MPTYVAPRLAVLARAVPIERVTWSTDRPPTPADVGVGASFAAIGYHFYDGRILLRVVPVGLEPTGMEGWYSIPDAFFAPGSWEDADAV
jgi:hypothetical protein